MGELLWIVSYLVSSLSTQILTPPSPAQAGRGYKATRLYGYKVTH